MVSDEGDGGRLATIHKTAEQWRGQCRNEQPEADRREHGREPADEEQRAADEHPGEQHGEQVVAPCAHWGTRTPRTGLAGLLLRVVHHDVLIGAGPITEYR